MERLHSKSQKTQDSTRQNQQTLRQGAPQGLRQGQTVVGAVKASTLLQEVSRSAWCDLHGAYEERGFKFRKLRHQEKGGSQAACDDVCQDAQMPSVIWCACPSCLAEEDAMRMRAQEQAKIASEQARLEARLERSWLPPRFVGKTLDTFVCHTPEQACVLERVKQYVLAFDENFAQGRGLIFLGGVGTGKSHLAAGILQAVISKHQGLYMTVPDLIRAVRGTWRKDAASSEEGMLRKLVEVDVLVLDEVGKQYGTQGETHILFDVLDGRYREMKPTILLGNVTPDELTLYLGERVADRLRETCTALVFSWGSYRK